MVVARERKRVTIFPGTSSSRRSWGQKEISQYAEWKELFSREIRRFRPALKKIGGLGRGLRLGYIPTATSDFSTLSLGCKSITMIISFLVTRHWKFLNPISLFGNPNFSLVFLGSLNVQFAEVGTARFISLILCSLVNGTTTYRGCQEIKFHFL